MGRLNHIDDLLFDIRLSPNWLTIFELRVSLPNDSHIIN